MDSTKLAVRTQALLTKVKGNSDLGADAREAAELVAELQPVLRFLEHRYYVEQDPLVADIEYDTLFRTLKDLESRYPELIHPDSPTQRIHQGLIESFDKVEHLTPMISLDNTTNLEELRLFHISILENLGVLQAGNESQAWRTRAKDLGDTLIESAPQDDLFSESTAGDLFTNLDGADLRYNVEPKFDGAGIALLYENNALIRGASRGNGRMGDDITANIRTIRALPLTVPLQDHGIVRMEVRGEAIIRLSDFEKVNERRTQAGEAPFANPRNACAGSLRLQDPTEVDQRMLSAFIYHISYMELADGTDPIQRYPKHTDRLELLQSLGFPVPEYGPSDGIDGTYRLCQEWAEKRDSLAYEIDGCVIKVDDVATQEQLGSTAHHPRWAVAYKIAARQSTTRLLDIELNVGRTGAVTPVAHLEPVALGGVVISRASLFNFPLVQKLDIRVGDTVLVERAGDVIPHVVKTIPDLRPPEATAVIPPEECPSCQSELVWDEPAAGDEVTGKVLRCVNYRCESQRVERIRHFASRGAMDIDGFGEAMAAQLVGAALIRDVADIFTLTMEQILPLERMAQTSAENLLRAIDEARDRPCWRLLTGLGIRHVGTKVAQVLCTTYGSIHALAEAPSDDIAEIDGIGTVLAASISAWFRNPESQALLERLKTLGVRMEDPEQPSQASDALAGEIFVFTGSLERFSRQEAETVVALHGGKAVGSVSKKTTRVVAGPGAGSKLRKAESLSIPVMSEQEFLDYLDTYGIDIS
ncbi:MAG: DNA ligase (NAD(+)) LigA [Myxococcales bacterium]|nr:DNA ligase (NAD(+)) LigA [Myxococcales bacterium]